MIEDVCIRAASSRASARMGMLVKSRLSYICWASLGIVASCQLSQASSSAR